MLLFSVGLTRCKTNDDDGKSAKAQTHPKPQGIEGAFVASCASTVGCCAQCFEYYGEPSQATLDLFKSGECGDYEKPCSTRGAIGICITPPEKSLAPSLTTVDVRYERNSDGETYATAEQAEAACATLGGVWQTLPDELAGFDGNNGILPVEEGNVPDSAKATGLSVGDSFACAVRSDGSVRCWGDNGWGQLGPGAGLADSATPVAVPGLKGVKAVAAGLGHACALKEDGTVACWGDNQVGQAGAADTTGVAPVGIVPGLDNVKAISAGGATSCALLEDGHVKCWGDNVRGRLGIGTKAVFSAAPVTVPV